MAALVHKLQPGNDFSVPLMAPFRYYGQERERDLYLAIYSGAAAAAFFLLFFFMFTI